MNANVHDVVWMYTTRYCAELFYTHLQQQHPSLLEELPAHKVKWLLAFHLFVNGTRVNEAGGWEHSATVHKVTWTPNGTHMAFVGEGLHDKNSSFRERLVTDIGWTIVPEHFVQLACSSWNAADIKTLVRQFADYCPTGAHVQALRKEVAQMFTNNPPRPAYDPSLDEMDDPQDNPQWPYDSDGDVDMSRDEEGDGEDDDLAKNDPMDDPDQNNYSRHDDDKDDDDDDDDDAYSDDTVILDDDYTHYIDYVSDSSDEKENATEGCLSMRCTTPVSFDVNDQHNDDDDGYDEKVVVRRVRFAPPPPISPSTAYWGPVFFMVCGTILALMTYGFKQLLAPDVTL